LASEKRLFLFRDTYRPKLLSCRDRYENDIVPGGGCIFRESVFPVCRHCLIIILLSCCCYVNDAAAGDDDWISSLSWGKLRTKYTEVYYQTVDQLAGTESKINFEPDDWYLDSLVSGKKQRSLNDRFITKIDTLFERVQEILDMRKRMGQVKIFIFLNKEQIDQAYKSIYKKEGHMRAWYSFDRHTIFLNAEDVNEGMVAHEMAHAIIDNFLQIRPPKASAEILARYVDKHL